MTPLSARKNAEQCCYCPKLVNNLGRVVRGMSRYVESDDGQFWWLRPDNVWGFIRVVCGKLEQSYQALQYYKC